MFGNKFKKYSVQLRDYMLPQTAQPPQPVLICLLFAKNLVKFCKQIVKNYISTSILSVQHPNADGNIQHLSVTIEHYEKDDKYYERKEGREGYNHFVLTKYLSDSLFFDNFYFKPFSSRPKSSVVCMQIHKVWLLTNKPL